PPPWSRYRAPEWSGSAVAGDSADVYSLGVLLWELLTVGRPRPRETGARPWIDPEVVRLVMRARSADVPTRPQDPGAFAAELASALARVAEGPRDAARGPRIAVDDEGLTVPGFVLPHFPDADCEKTVPGFVPPPLPDEDD